MSYWYHVRQTQSSGAPGRPMPRIAYLLLCHKDPDAVAAQARRLRAAGDYVAIHFDARAPRGAYAAIRSALDGDDGIVFARRRYRCGWGEWSLVAATIAAARAALAAFPRATHFYLLSGDCMPIKTAAYVRAYLDERDADFIESVDYFESGWIRTGLQAERLIYRHWFNERKYKRLFYGSMAVQKRLGFERPLPPGLRMMIGSQWWCLRRRTLEAVLALADTRPGIVRFFRTTWIPDETFFQTLVRAVVPETEIRSLSPTFLIFSDYGMPVAFCDDHYDFLVRQDHLFARKISPEATTLGARLGALYSGTERRFDVSDDGRRVYQFLTGRGRVGRRFGPRAWEPGPSTRELMVVTCKKWHVAKRLAGAMRGRLNAPVFEYLYDEDAAELPDLGGLEAGRDKRSRNAGAFLNVLYDHSGAERMVLCLDPSRIDILQGLVRDIGVLRVLQIVCALPDAYLVGHAHRTGLASAATPDAAVQAMLPAIRGAIEEETLAIAALGLDHLELMREEDGAERNAVSLAAFLSLDHAAALGLAAVPHLFSD